MKDTMERLQIRTICLVVLISLSALSGCVGPKIASDLLANVRTNEKSLTNNLSVTTVVINPRINNYEEIDESVKQSLEMALASARIFGTDSSMPYRINANVLTASQPAWSFGSFEGKLEIRYVVRDPTGKEILDKTIFTTAGSDKWFFSGAARHRRARAVNISTNVLQFVDSLQGLLQK